MIKERENTIYSTLKSLEDNVRNIKTAQPIGRDSMLSYSSYSNNSYDYSFRIFTADPHKFFRITVFHDNSDRSALLRMAVYVRANNPEVMADPIPYVTPTSPAVYVRWAKEVPPQSDMSSWIVSVEKGIDGIEYDDAYFKFFFYGTDGVKPDNWIVTPI